MPIDDQDNTRPDPTRSDWNWDSTPNARKPDRTTYEAARRAELDHIRRLDVTHRQLLNYNRPQRIRGDDDLRDRGDLSGQDSELYDKAAHELHMNHRVLVHAVEGYLLGCVRPSSLTGEIVLRQTRSTDQLCAALQAEEDLMIRTFGTPWVDPPSPSSSRSFQPLEVGQVPTGGTATSDTPAPRRWPWK
jgi:hypothetical protein